MELGPGTLTLRSLQTRSASVAFIFLDFLFRHRTTGYIWAKTRSLRNESLCTPNDRRSGFFSKTFHWWFVCCVPPLIGPKRVVKSGAQRVQNASERLETGSAGFGAVFRGAPPRLPPPVRRCAARNSRPQAAKRPAEFIMPRAARTGTSTHGE
jgi:hypothetical protein